MFLKKARSLLKMGRWRSRFLCRPPMSPCVPGLAKHAGLIENANPVESAPAGLVGSHTNTGRAFMSPPVKSVTPVHLQVVVAPGSSAKPGAQSAPVGSHFCPVEIVYEAPL